MPNLTQKNLGMPVHYSLKPTECRAAHIVEVQTDDRVNLAIFANGVADRIIWSNAGPEQLVFWSTARHHSDTLETGTWHFIEECTNTLPKPISTA